MREHLPAGKLHHGGERPCAGPQRQETQTHIRYGLGVEVFVCLQVCYTLLCCVRVHVCGRVDGVGSRSAALRPLQLRPRVLLPAAPDDSAPYPGLPPSQRWLTTTAAGVRVKPGCLRVEAADLPGGVPCPPARRGFSCCCSWSLFDS